MCSVGFNGNFKPAGVEGFNDSVIKLKERFASSAHNKFPASRVVVWPMPLNCHCKVFCGFELPAAWAINTNEVGIAKPAYGARPVIFMSRPKITTGEAAENCRATRLGAFALEGVENLLHGIAHVFASSGDS